MARGWCYEFPPSRDWGTGGAFRLGGVDAGLQSAEKECQGTDPMKEKWQRIIEGRRDYDHPDYPISQWKRDALSGQTRKGYADCVSTLLVESRAPIPEVLKQFKQI